ncbi:MAG: ABC transporter permease [Reichenbachiella sp.]|uniref:ABC transporter permease n=1 Tax=Reichenbachiella sp. TaxID=2184521 RepID=UPI003262FF64
MKDVKTKPPKWPLKLLSWFCKPYYKETVEGDLIEIYERQVAAHVKYVKLRFLWNVIRFFRIRYIKNLEDIRPKTSYGMFKNYFKVSLRSMRKNSTYTLLNILGLSIGIASCLLLISHISHQLSFDKYVQDGHRIYRLVNDRGSTNYSPFTPTPAVQQMLLEFPEIESGTRIYGLYDVVLKMDNQFIKQNDILSADSTFFDIFPTKFLNGKVEYALNSPNSIVLTQSVADQLFEDQNPMGKTVVYDEDAYQVTAVVADQPKNSTIPYRAIFSFPHDKWLTDGNWSGNNVYSYLKLKAGADPERLREKFLEFTEKHLSEELIAFMSEYDSWSDFLAAGNHRSFEIVPLMDIHLNHQRLTLNNPGNRNNTLTFSIIAAFILLIACINYINMSTAKSSLRLKEVGLRKVLGSVRKHLVQQFLLESVLITLVSVLLGVILAILVLPYFNIMTDADYGWRNIINLNMLGWVVAFVIVVGLVAGSYPALYLSSFKPIDSLRKEAVKGRSSRLRTVLVIFQFTVSVFLITATFIVFHQVQHVSSRDLGMNADQIFVVRNDDRLGNNYQAFVNDLMSSVHIEQLGALSHYPSGRIYDWSYLTMGENAVTLNPDNIFADSSALQTLGLQLVAGSFFQGMATDSTAVVVNESFARKAGWTEPVGQLLNRGRSTRFRVIGVVKDFILRNGQYNTREVIFRYASSNPEYFARYIHIRTSSDFVEALSVIETAWNKYVPGYPFEGFFLDESFDRLYAEERRFGHVFTSFSGLAIIIASIGLFSLAAFSLERRTKEIAIRKVLGATARRIMYHLVFGFLKLILVGAILAFPAIYYLGNEWLNGFDYRIVIDAPMIVLPILLLGAISISIIGLKTYKAAMDNPVNALKAE